MNNKRKYNFIDMKGQKIGLLTVIRDKGKDKYGKALWLVECECGNNFVTLGASLRSGHTQSCGCTRNVWAKEMGKRNKTHGETGSRLYYIWQNMKDRCYNNTHKSYEYYGGRGITVCEEWLKSYEKFSEWSRSNGYADNLTIDRIDVDGDYSPTNCRWATQSEQQRNRRDTILYDYFGRMATQAEIMELTGLSKYKVKKRLINGVFVKESDL